MINSLLNKDNKSKLSAQNIINEVYLIQKWEKIKNFCFTQKKFFFVNNSSEFDLYRKFSSRNMLEKYIIKYKDEKYCAAMDLKIYKDCVYIINLDIKSLIFFDNIAEKLLQTAIEKALYNTTEKEVKINLTQSLIIKSKLRKILARNEFIPEENQSDYEKNMFGETFSIKVTNNSIWQKRIKQLPILINK